MTLIEISFVVPRRGKPEKLFGGANNPVQFLNRRMLVVKISACAK